MPGGLDGGHIMREEDGKVWLTEYEWKARELNKLFAIQGVTGRIGKIKPETIKNGERKRADVYRLGSQTNRGS